MTKETLREELADLEHEQWLRWSSYVANHNKLPKELVDKWVKNWKPYSELNEKTKDSDRIWADKVLKIFKEKIQNAQRRIKEDIKFRKQFGQISIAEIEIISKIIKTVFKEEFGGKLI